MAGARTSRMDISGILSFPTSACDPLRNCEALFSGKSIRIGSPGILFARRTENFLACRGYVRFVRVTFTTLYQRWNNSVGLRVAADIGDPRHNSKPISRSCISNGCNCRDGHAGRLARPIECNRRLNVRFWPQANNVARWSGRLPTRDYCGCFRPRAAAAVGSRSSLCWQHLARPVVTC